MNVNSITIDKEFIINELRSLGIKYSKKKEKNKVPEKLTKKQIFKTHLHLLELTDVILANGEIVQIPSFVSECCQLIIDEVQTEGLFRKSGSTCRQKEIRRNVEAGLQLGKNYNVVDVANILKAFFRELPEALLPSYIQEVLIRSYLIVEGNLDAILLSCLLLPPLTINTLAYFMQFLYMISLHSKKNLMTIENLAIIFTPSLMPANDLTSKNHVKIIEVLIKNSNRIGVLPNASLSKLQQNSFSSNTQSSDLSSADGDKRKKKRRSASLGRMINGIKKMVGAIGSSENLEKSSDNANNIATPCISKSTKKRKLTENDIGSSNKLKNDIFGLLPNGNVLPNTPARTKAEKKTVMEAKDFSDVKHNIERRWSAVGSALTKQKPQSFTKQVKKGKHFFKPLSPIVSLPNLPKMDLDNTPNSSHSFTSVSVSSPVNENNSHEIDYLKISKKEYEQIMKRVASIEKRISQEFGEKESQSFRSNESDKSSKEYMSGPEKVINKFEQINDETTSHQMSPSATLANKLSRELKIRRSDRIIRSPSARKIGSIRRRSRDDIKSTRAKRLTRNASWHVNTSSQSAPAGSNIHSYTNTVNFYPNKNLKRGRPNTIQTGLVNLASEHGVQNEYENIDKIIKTEQWTSGEEFFKENSSSINNKNSYLNTPDKFVTVINMDDDIKTPMLPPKTNLHTHFKTPRISAKSTTKIKSVLTQFKQLSNDIDEFNGRASIARLRTTNAGHVMAKAKLFDDLNDTDDCPNISKINASATNLKGLKINNISKTSRLQLNEKHSHTQSRILNSKSPNKIQKQSRVVGTKYPNNKILSEIVIDEDILTPKKITATKFRQLNNINRNVANSPKNTPKIKKNFKINSPRKLIKTPKFDKDLSNCRTPIRAKPIVRSSPRFNLHT